MKRLSVEDNHSRSAPFLSAPGERVDIPHTSARSVNNLRGDLTDRARFICASTIAGRFFNLTFHDHLNSEGRQHDHS